MMDFLEYLMAWFTWGVGGFSFAYIVITRSVRAWRAYKARQRWLATPDEVHRQQILDRCYHNDLRDRMGAGR